jgi:hypothetical protein
MLSDLTKAHLFSVLLFLQMFGFEWRQPKVWVSVSSSERGLLWSGNLTGVLMSYDYVRCVITQPKTLTRPLPAAARSGPPCPAGLADTHAPGGAA